MQSEHKRRLLGKWPKGRLYLEPKRNHRSGEKRGLNSPSQKSFEGIEHSYDQRVEAGHHRQENRQIWVVPAVIEDLYQPSPWAGLQAW